MYNNETKDKFVELRVEGLSFDKIAAQLGASKSTLHRWAEEREADIARLRRLHWEEMENEFGWRFEHQLLELNSSIDACEEHLRRIPVSQLSVRETVMLLRESRRQRDRLRALLMGTGTPSRKSNKTERFAENATTQPHNTNDLQQSSSESFDSVTPEVTRGLTSPETTDNTSVQPANAAQNEEPKSNKTERIAENATTQPRNTNDLQQTDSQSFDFQRPPAHHNLTPNPNPDSASQSQIANPKSQIEERPFAFHLSCIDRQP